MGDSIGARQGRVPISWIQFRDRAPPGNSPASGFMPRAYDGPRRHCLGTGALYRVNCPTDAVAVAGAKSRAMDGWPMVPFQRTDKRS